MFGAIATIERNIMLERQRKGIAKAAAEGKYKSRKATARAKSADVLRLTASGGTREGDHGHVGDQPGHPRRKQSGGVTPAATAVRRTLARVQELP
jgi:DNA invertase Pin-like site-specific DNA recombinase